jgi:hypothetical protein
MLADVGGFGISIAASHMTEKKANSEYVLTINV